jgi:hypothetical protein
MKVVFMSSDKATFHYANHHIISVWRSEHMQFWNMSEIALTWIFFVHSEKQQFLNSLFFIQKTIIVISLLISLLSSPLGMQVFPVAVHKSTSIILLISCLWTCRMSGLVEYGYDSIGPLGHRNIILTVYVSSFVLNAHPTHHSQS